MPANGLVYGLCWTVSQPFNTPHWTSPPVSSVKDRYEAIPSPIRSSAARTKAGWMLRIRRQGDGRDGAEALVATAIAPAFLYRRREAPFAPYHQRAHPSSEASAYPT